MNEREDIDLQNKKFETFEKRISKNQTFTTSRKKILKKSKPYNLKELVEKLKNIARRSFQYFVKMTKYQQIFEDNGLLVSAVADDRFGNNLELKSEITLIFHFILR